MKLDESGSANNITHPVTGGMDNRHPEASNFNQLIENNRAGGGWFTPPSKPESVGQSDFGSQGIAGGFLLYPNTANTASMRSVYSKP